MVLSRRRLLTQHSSSQKHMLWWKKRKASLYIGITDDKSALSYKPRGATET